jgi:hypothetical protein
MKNIINSLMIIVFLFNLGLSQSFSSVKAVFAASDGKEILPAEDAEDNLDDMVEYLTAAFNLKSADIGVFKLSQPGMFEKFSGTLKSFMDSDDSSRIALAVLLGAWGKEGVGDNTYTLSLNADNKLTIEQLVNEIRFIPLHRFIIFSIAPAKFGIPYAYLRKGSDRKLRAGKLLIDVKGDPEDDYDDWVSDFSDVLDDVNDDIENADTDGNKIVTFNEWLEYLSFKAKEEKFTLTPFLFRAGEDFTVYRFDRK